MSEPTKPLENHGDELALAVRAAVRGARPGRRTAGERAALRARVAEVGLLGLSRDERSEFGAQSIRLALAALAEIDASLALECALGGEPNEVDDAPQTTLGLISAPARALRGEEEFGEVAAVALGIARGALAAADAHAGTRVQFGAPLARLGAIRAKLVAMRAEVARVSALLSAGALHDALPVALDAAVAVAHEALQIHGGVGFTTDAPAEGFFRDALELRARFV